MTLLEFFGCTLIAFGPPFSMFCLTVCKDPIRIIILISAAFFWLLALLFSSVVWFVVVPLRTVLIFGVIVSVILQESFRYLFYRLLKEAESGLQKVSEVGMEMPIVTNRVTLSYVAGLGFGIMSGAFSLVNVLADAIGPGTVGIRGDSPNFFIVSAFTTLAFILLHTFWGIIFFQALDSKNYLVFSYVLISHIVVSCLTLFNQKQLYAASLIPIYIITMITACVAFRSAGGSLNNVKQTIRRQN
ncbi:gamma-secretase subunit Aph-1-like protein [Leptotrombidium deliense]|uniref:Gamma-secretase subunit Aph-1-like protein n=1 Tax=Leptotrombidium deliense TaxID=299467 RepID=A0A443SVM3_9ACAR|nr:gamma-secretase subunit Aph-1-like protein [Leptotrombidium deliense]